MLAPFDGPDRIAGDLRVGEIRALRTFRLPRDGSGALLPVAHATVAWTDGPNTARCDRGGHAPAAPGCSCGFYAYGSRRAARQHDEARRVLAVVACWGRVVPGTLGLRAQHARIEAIWVSRRVPLERVLLVQRRYPSVAFYGSRRAMLRQHRLTRLDSYERLPLLGGRRARRWLRVRGEGISGCLIYAILGIGISLLGNGVWLLIRLLWHAI
jgi:hypothetical protein